MDKHEKDLLIQAIDDPDNFALRIVYTSVSGIKTRRYISPFLIKPSPYVGGRQEAVYAMDLCEARTLTKAFRVDGISEVELIDAADILPPMPLATIG